MNLSRAKDWSIHAQALIFDLRDVRPSLDLSLGLSLLGCLSLAKCFLQKVQGIFLGFLGRLTGRFRCLVEGFVSDVLWVAHIVVGHLTSAVVAHNVFHLSKSLPEC